VNQREISAAAELRATVERLRNAIRGLDDRAAAVVVASLGRGSLDILHSLLGRADPTPDPATLELLAEDLDADAMARLHGWILARLEVDALLQALIGTADHLDAGWD
jgi:hypothetical protein